MEETIAYVAVKGTSYSFDKEFSYLVPKELKLNALAGYRVVVPFGAGNRKRQGIILETKQTNEPVESLKSIIFVLDKTPILNDEMLKLLKWMKSRYFCTYFEALRPMLPVGIEYKMEESYSVSRDISPKISAGFTETEKKVVDFLLTKTVPIKRNAIIKTLCLSGEDQVIDKLYKNGIINRLDNAVRKGKDFGQKMIRLTGSDECKKLTKRQKEVYEMLSNIDCASVKEVSYYTGAAKRTIDELVKKGAAEYFEDEIFRIPYSNVKLNESSDKKLTPRQKVVYEDLKAKLNENKACASLLYGITGSGKTSVFMKLIDDVTGNGREVILMVPEIALTTQIIKLFKEKYGDKVSVFHSGLSMGERLDEYKRVREGKANIVIGTRSAVFAPFKNLGLIIMDEEQEYTYKSESTPRFNARDVAKFRANYNKCMLLLASATPSLESYYAAKAGIYSLSILGERYGKSKLPEVIIADMNLELLSGNDSILSDVLLENIENTLNKKNQVILLLNRRGYNTFVSCRSCKEIVVCHNCGISMTYHNANNKLMCHYCGYSTKNLKQCPSCGEEKLSYAGKGTQHLEQDLEKFFPKAKVLRLDADTTMAKYSFDKKFKEFADRKYDIMVGTQMVAKGLDFPNVTLVGVINADSALYSDDFRSYERAFSLITQVVGRSGRGNEMGKAIIQTNTPENSIIKLASEQDYSKFYESEIEIRKVMLYPPFSNICVIGFLGKNKETTKEASITFFNNLSKLAKSDYKDLPLRVFSPTAARLPKVNLKYRYKMIAKFKNMNRFKGMIDILLKDFYNEKNFLGVTVFVDVNPYSII